MSVKPFSKEELNYLKFASIVHDEFPKMLRSTFVELWNAKIAPLPDYQVWNDTPAERKLLLNRGGKTKIPITKSLEDWDCTALFQATLYSNTFGTITISPTTKKPSPFHSSLISPTGNPDETIALAIDQVRLLRNTLCHMPQPSITKADFDDYVRHAKDAFDATGFSTCRIDDIGNLEEEDFPTEKVNELKKGLQENNIFLREDVLKGLTTLNEKIDKIEENTKFLPSGAGNYNNNKNIKN